MTINGVKITDIHVLIANVLIKHLESNEENKVITYGEVTKRIGGYPEPYNLNTYLGDLSNICRINGLPLISAIVVNQDTMMPGSGLIKTFYEHIINKEEADRQWIECYKETVDCSNWTNLKELLNII